MSYLVLARKYRPVNFDEVAGQSHITDILKSAITSDRVGQAYLFCGPRGIGKTSCARILSKALNCEQGVTPQPCGVCEACKSIAQGNSFDVLEIDGASNRGIDEIRAIRENVKFAPSYGRYKIYIVDEVHMLTTEAFNALLKTLEEPPDHVKFIFATTDPNKLPATIISRCQRFDFKRISFNELCDSLQKIADREKIKADKEALYAIAKAAKGSFRDALSILDQVGALSERDIKGGDVYGMLGLVEIDMMFSLVDALGSGDCAAVLQVFDAIVEKGKDIKQLGKDLLEHFRNLMIIKLAGNSVDQIKEMGKLVDYPGEVKNLFLRQSQFFDLKEILSAVDIFVEAQETARVMESERTPMEIAFAKLTLVLNQRTRPVVVSESMDPLPKSGSPERSIISNQKGQVNASDAPVDYDSGQDADENLAEGFPDSEPSSADPADNQGFLDDRDDFGDIEEMGTADASLSEVTQTGISFDLASVKEAWSALTYAVSRERMSLATYLQEGVPAAVSGNRLTIAFSPAYDFFKESLESNDNKQLVEQIFSAQLKKTVIVAYVINEGAKPVISEKDHSEVKDILDVFGGEITSRWHNE